MPANVKRLVRRGLNVVSARTLVLLYHRVADVAEDPWGLAVRPKHFAEQLQVIRSIGAVSLHQAKPSGMRPLAPKCSIALTFDDGYSDNYRNALPLLEKFEVPATFFITVGYVGQAVPFWWDELRSVILGSTVAHKAELEIAGQTVTIAPKDEEQPADALRRIYPIVQQLDAAERAEAIATLRSALGFHQTAGVEDFAMTEEELQKTAASPFAEIGAHTVTHPKLSALSFERQFQEIADSKQQLQTLLNREITSFSYPFGAAMHFNEGTERLVKASGFQRACTTEGVAFRQRHAAFRIPRLYVPDVGGEQFSRWLWSYLK